jgi:hypothetical protein
MPDKENVFVFNPKDNGGEQLVLTTKFIYNGDNICTEQELTLLSYCNSASFKLYTAPMTADKLRELANQLDKTMSEITIKRNN